MTLSTLEVTRTDVTLSQLQVLGFALWVRRGLGPVEDARARAASRTEAHFLLGKLPAEVTGLGSAPSYSWTEPCDACGEVHPC